MPLSMTGFGHGENSENGILIRVDIKSLNSRFLDLNFKLQRTLSEFENKIAIIVKEYLIRGRVTIHIECELDGKTENGLILDELLLDQFMKTAAKAGQILGQPKLPDIEYFLNQPDVLKKELQIDKEQIDNCLEKTLIFALQETLEMRKIEGGNLTVDLQERLSQICKCLEKINILTEKHRDKLLQRYRDKIQKLIEKTDIDDVRLNQEISIMIERRDISEEIVRFKSHTELFQSYFKEKNGQIGKKMNFLLQEMSREVNTIGSKTDLSEISHIVVDMKDDLEKMREQVQNIL